MATRRPAGGHAGTDKPLRSHAFGINIEATFRAPGLPEGSRRLPRTRVERVPEQTIADHWIAAGAQRLQEERLSAGSRRPDRTIERGAGGEYLLYARHFGTALISPSGDRVLCAPPAVAAWRWQRFLVGRVLPWAAVLRGRELLHASAVRVGDNAVAILAGSGYGKSSVAVRLMLQGARFITDDVLALTTDDDRVLAHPGPAIAALRPAERDALEPQERRRLGRVLGRSGKTYVAVDREPAAVPLGGIYFLERTSGGGRRFERGVDARRLLGSAFVAGVDSRRRLVGLLDLCARLEAVVPIWRVEADYGAGAAPVAEAIWEHTGAAASGS